MADPFGEALERVGDAIQEAAPAIVRRHRAAGILTWRLMHQMESELFAELEATGRHHPQLLRMMRSAGVMDYPKDDREFSMEGHDVAPAAFGALKEAWERVD
jgi:hypothetical protein